MAEKTEAFWDRNKDVDLEPLLVILRQRYCALYEIKHLTEELQEAGEREDAVSVQLILKMRADEMEKIEKYQSSIRRLIQSGYEKGERYHRLMSENFLKEPGSMDGAEEEVWELRKKTQEMISCVQNLDRNFNIHAAGAKSFYR